MSRSTGTEGRLRRYRRRVADLSSPEAAPRSGLHRAWVTARGMGVLALLDLNAAVKQKLKLNGEKYPVSKAHGTSKKYDQL